MFCKITLRLNACPPANYAISEAGSKYSREWKYPENSLASDNKMAVLVVISQDQARQVRNRKKRSRCKVISIVTFSSKFIYVLKRLVNKRSIQGCLNFYDKKGIVLFELLRTKKVCLGVTHIMILGSKKKKYPPTHLW